MRVHQAALVGAAADAIDVEQPDADAGDARTERLREPVDLPLHGGARNVTEGMLILSVVDTARNAEVWNGRVSRQLGKNGAPNSALVREAVDELLRDFPAHAGRAP